MQKVLDQLYAESKAGKEFTKLYNLIIQPSNIMLAYRNIKANTGSKTKGVNGKTIEDWKLATSNDYVDYVQRRLQNYFPHKVRRVEIPKPNGSTRPLGIPTIEDRLIQQCIKQILEPILEAKFYPQSFGFRPNRDTTHAIAEFYRKVNIDGFYFIVDVDIKGFFDNVNHSKLLKQLWTLGIRDKQIISIISKMLKAEIDGIGKPDKGTPQGGILSPLLANVVLNELDWWVDSQWKGFEIKERTPRFAANGTRDRGNEFQVMRAKTNLKEIQIIRYADDFKIFCKSKDEAVRAYRAVKAWLKDRLSLDISPEKSGIVDIRSKPSEFLGFNIKAKLKGGKYVIQSHLSDKTKERVLQKLRKAVDYIHESPTIQRVSIYNSIVLGQQNYYSKATEVGRDFADIDFALYAHRKNQLKSFMQTPKRGKKKSSKEETLKLSRTYQKFYGKYNYQRQFVLGICLFPVPAVKFKKSLSFSPRICDYTVEGRTLIHDNLRLSTKTLHYLMENVPRNSSIELADNRLSVYTAQQGRCGVSGEILTIGDMELHHKQPKALKGTDEYKNLVWVTLAIHKLIHATEAETIAKYLSNLSLNKEARDKLNKLRELAGNSAIK